MLADDVELLLERRSENGLALVEPFYSRNGREHEVARADAERCAIGATEGIVALNAVVHRQLSPGFSVDPVRVRTRLTLGRALTYARSLQARSGISSVVITPTHHRGY
ncbi:MAG TPA: hypothetical protein VL856_08980, partial [Acidimicrobiia bacterium]|nr:hypothetical protein [Acidimicrobiia bacterium]